jgi:hypothetical protein
MACFLDKITAILEAMETAQTAPPLPPQEVVSGVDDAPEDPASASQSSRACAAAAQMKNSRRLKDFEVVSRPPAPESATESPPADAPRGTSALPTLPPPEPLVHRLATALSVDRPWQRITDPDRAAAYFRARALAMLASAPDLPALVEREEREAARWGPPR